jgi:hypothetical protein
MVIEHFTHVTRYPLPSPVSALREGESRVDDALASVVNHQANDVVEREGGPFGSASLPLVTGGC